MAPVENSNNNKQRKLAEIQIPEQKVDKDGIPLPAVLVPSPGHGENVTVTDFVAWIKQDKKWIEERLHRSGAVLFRNCGVKSGEDFNTVVEAFGYEEASYAGGQARRSQVVGRVFTANESPLEVSIPFHHELAQSPAHPLKLFFFCELAPTKGGETPLVRSHAVVERLSKEWPEFYKQLEEKGLLYQQYYGDNDKPGAYIVRSWTQLFHTADKVEAEKLFAEKYGGRMEWLSEGGVKLFIGPKPAFKWDAAHGRNSFFNYIVMSYNSKYENDDHVEDFEGVVFGDGSSLPKDAVAACSKIMNEEKVEFKWQDGDLLIVDNVAVQHARNPCFSSRRVLASLSK